MKHQGGSWEWAFSCPFCLSSNWWLAWWPRWTPVWQENISKPHVEFVGRQKFSATPSDSFFMLNFRIRTGGFLSSSWGTHRIHSPGSNWSCLDTLALGKPLLWSPSSAASYEAFSEDVGPGSPPQTQADSPHLPCLPNLQVWFWAIMSVWENSFLLFSKLLRRGCWLRCKRQDSLIL